MNLIIERIDTSLPMPTYAHEGDAGFDLYAAENVHLNLGETVLVKTGVRMCIPDGYEIQIRPRSSMAKEGVICPNSPGTVDAGYRGEIFVPLHLIEHNSLMGIPKGKRIAQAVLAPVTRANIVEGTVDTDTERGTGGFGSTGK